MTVRSMLFVPGDSEKKLAKGAGTMADALILDLEDAVAAARKPAARETVLAFLKEHPTPRKQKLWVRINSVDTREAVADLDGVVAGAPDAILLPKASGAADVEALDRLIAPREARAGLPAGAIEAFVVATETGAAIFGLGTYSKTTPRLAGLTWGAEDLSAAVGAFSNSDENGNLTHLYLLARSLCLAASAAAEVQAIDTVYTKIGDVEGLCRVCNEARRDGFRGKMAIHPDQVDIINAAFTPSDAEIAHARKIVDLFAANPGVGTLALEGRMLDRPHLTQAERVLALHAELKDR